MGLVARLREAFAADPTQVDLSDEQQWDDIHAICGLLKMYIRELKEPILTSTAYSDFIGLLIARPIDCAVSFTDHIPVQRCVGSPGMSVYPDARTWFTNSRYLTIAL
jgi:hypothetical protein